MRWGPGLVVAALALPLAACQSGAAPPAGCASGPGGPVPSAGTAGRVQWSAPIDRTHNTLGPAVVGPLLYVPTSVWGTAEAFEHDNRVTAFDPADGRQVWRQGGVLDAVDGAVYVSGVNGNSLLAWEPRGERVRWTHVADDVGTDHLLGTGGMHAATAPGVLLAYRGGESPGYLARLDPASGGLLWTLAEPPDMLRRLILRGDTAYLDSYAMGGLTDVRFSVSAVDVATGRVRWQRPGTEPSGVGGGTTLAERDGRLAVILGNPDEGSEESKPATLVVIDGRTGKDLWSQLLGDYVSPYEHTYLDVTAGGVLHSYAGRLTDYDPASGAVRWTLDMGASPERKERNRSHAAGLIRIAPGGLLITGDDRLSCVDPATGAVRWTAATGVPFVNGAAVAGDVAYVWGLRDPGGEDFSPASYVQALDLRTGNRLWRYEKANTPMRHLASTDTAVFVLAGHSVQRIGP